MGEGCEEINETKSSLGMTTFDVSSNNPSTHYSSRSLAFRLTSGPSKNGPGH
ncbi:unnamed protein product [Lupinus luteus]|uniref:Uncharacterized protein n=1 Tax=Lupinus luteus TaxID=3873 RepID=A0AAV1XSH8_LUPLU